MWPYLYRSWVTGRFLKGRVAVTWHFRGSWDSAGISQAPKTGLW